MTNGNDILEFEEKNYDRLVRDFIECEENREKWKEFVYEEFINEKPLQQIEKATINDLRELK